MQDVLCHEPEVISVLKVTALQDVGPCLGQHCG